MKKLLAAVLVMVMCSAPAAVFAEEEEAFPYPFGLTEDMTQLQAAETLRDRIGKMTKQNLPKGYVNYYIEPGDLTMGDFPVVKIIVSGVPDHQWNVILEMEETDPPQLARHFLDLYRQMKETYGDPDGDPYDGVSETSTGRSRDKLNVELDDPEALAAELNEYSGWHQGISYTWKDRAGMGMETWDYGTASELTRISVWWHAFYN